MTEPRIKQVDVQSGTQVLIAAPANPIAPEIAAAIGSAAGSIRGVLEAHLPYCYIPGVTEESAQVLVLVLGRGVFADAVVQELGARLKAGVPQVLHLDVWPILEDDEVLSAVRATGCIVFP